MGDLSGGDTVREKPKHKKMSGGDCRVSKQDFQALEKLCTTRQTGWVRRDGSDEMAQGPRERACVAH